MSCVDPIAALREYAARHGAAGTEGPPLETTAATSPPTQPGREGDHSDLADALRAIDVSDLDHDAWIKAGTVLKKCGCPFETFDSWSATDTRQGQYRGTEFTRRQWESFDVSGEAPSSGWLVEVARRYGWRPSVAGRGGGRREATMPRPAEKSGSQPLAFENASDVVGTSDEYVHHVVSDLLDAEDVLEIVGEGGVGKSWCLLGIAIAAATGTKWAGLRFEAGDVLFVNPEIQAQKFRNRLRRLFVALGITAEDIGDRLMFKTLRGDVRSISEIRDAISGRRFELVCLDSLYMLHDAEENSASEMKGVILDLIATAKASGAIVATTLHTGKGASGSRRAVDRARGSSVLHGGPDVMLTIDRLRVEEGSGAWELLQTYGQQIGGSYVAAKPLRLTFAKVRDYADRKPIDLIFRWPVFVVDDTGELAECPIEGSPADNARRAARTKAQESREIAEAQAEALDCVILELEAEGVAPTRAACLERFNAKRQEMGLEPVSKTTFAAYTRKGGILPHRVNAQEGCVLYRPTEGVGGDSA